MENVKNLINKQFKLSFNKIITELKEYGYNIYWKLLNSKNYGIPQNRERIFCIGIKKDIDNNLFEFPKGFDNGIRLKDILEKSVDDKYYLSEKIQKRFKFNEKQYGNIIGTTKPDFRTIGQRDLVYGIDGPIGCLVATDYKQPKQIIEFNIQNTTNDLIQVGELGINDNNLKQIGLIGDKNSQGNRVYSIDGISTSMIANAGGLGAKTGLYLESISPAPELIGGIGEINFGKQYRQGNRVYSAEKTAMALMAQPVGNSGGYSYLYNVDYRIRKLTPKECWRLMGFDDKDFEKAKSSNISDTQLYKQAGNSIVVNVLEYIFKNMFLNDK